jgi:asparagine synthase (glutamine-hydrolysing)
MCGIAGIFALNPSAPEVDRDELLRIRDAMWRRGPDDSGLWLSADRRVGLAHRRLAIIDLTETGAQPMASADGTLHITFNGEIYNYRELRADLEAKGHQFRSTSDTEVLLNLYREHGPGMVEHLRGMFAFGIWDERKQGLFLARDPFGIKPLYYADDGSTIRFASQVKALLAGGRIDAATSPAGLVGFCLWGSVPEPHTLYRGIRTLTSGAMMWVERDKARLITRHFSISEELARAQQATALSRQEMRQQLAEALADSVRHHMVADVPVGVFLSSGLDSTTIAGLAAQGGPAQVASLTLGFREYANTQNDEVPLARLAANHYGMEHHAHLVSKADFDHELPRIREAMDQPSIDGVNTFFVSRAASRAGMKVALSGSGGDELFGGYPSFSQIPRLVNALSPLRSFTGVGRALRFVSAPLLKHFTSPKYAGLLEYGASYGGAYLLRRGLFMPWELTDLFDPEFVKAGWSALQPIARLDRKTGKIPSPHAKVAAMEMRMYMRNQLLRDADWAGMAWSLEIRTPLVDKALFRAVVPWMGSAIAPRKADMAAAPRKALPPEILGRKKTGFSIPVSTWLGPAGEGRGLRGWARALIDDRIAAL